MIALAELIERFEPALLQRYDDRLLPSQRQALGAMKRCRTRFAPRMLAQCTACGEQRSVPHSCGHRACPHCQHHEGQLWLQRQLELQVPANYFLITFTLPWQLRGLAWSHQRVVCGYLFNHKALAKVFRAKVLDAVEHAGLRLPERLASTWVVDCRCVGDGSKALLYLGRYLYRGVIQESDILRCENDQVTFRYRDAKTGKTATRTLPGADFLWLVLQHVLPKGLWRARNFGFLHPNSAGAIRLLQVLHLRAAPPAGDAANTPTRPAWRCACGQPMRVVCRRMAALEPLQPDCAGQAQPWRVVRPDKPGAGQVHTMH